MNNLAVRHARGSVLTFINDDVEVVRPGWLPEMLRLALQPDVAVVGCRLLYPDGTIQHAGLVLGIGEATGGLDESLGNSFNDVDFCLRAQARGYRNVVTPHAVLVHREGATRGRGAALAAEEEFRREVALMRDRWGDVLSRDPHTVPTTSA